MSSVQKISIRAAVVVLAAAVLAFAPQVQAQAQQGSSSAAGQKLGQIERLVGRMRGASSFTALQAAQLSQQLRAVDADVSAARSDLAATRASLVGTRVASSVLARHDDVASQFEQRAAAFDRVSKAWLASGNPQTLGNLATFFQQYPGLKSGAGNAGTLPWGTSPSKRLPAETKVAWYQRITRELKIELAQAYQVRGGVKFQYLPDDTQTPQDADVAETAEVTLTPAVRAQAEALGGNPVQIDNWVRNNVQWLPTWGALQTADMTLKSMRGNAFDIASLEIALLRASGIPARYQFGTIEVPAARLQNWIGGVAQPQDALDLLTQGGIAARGIETSGAITSVRMEHVWVSAYVNWSPSRGALAGGWNLTPPQHPNPNGALNAWVPLDASYKQNTLASGSDLSEISPFNAQSLFDAARSGAACTAGTASQLNVSALSAHYASFVAVAKGQFSATGAAVSVARMLGSRAIAPTQPKMFAGTLPYPTIVMATPIASISASQQWSLQIDLVDGLTSVFTAKKTWEQLDGQTLSLGFVPESPDDAQTLAGLLRPASGGDASTGLPSRIPAYLLKVKAQLSLNGQVIAEGGSFTLGQALTLRTTVQGPDGISPVAGDAVIVSGETHAWSVRGHAEGLSSAKSASDALNALRSAYAAANPPSGGSQAATLLGALAATYQSLVDARVRLYQRVGGMVEVRLPSIVRASSRFEDDSVFGLVTYVRPSGVGLDVDRYGSASAARDASAASGVKGYRQQALQRASLTAQQVLDAAFGPSGAGAQSSLSALALAAQTQTVLRADAATASVLDSLDANSTIRDQVNAAIAGGQEALLPATSTDLGGLPMDSLILRDVQTGNSAYWVTSRNAPAVQLTAQRPGLAGWLGLADAAASQALAASAVDSLITQLNTAQSLTGDIDAVQWSSFAGQNEVIDGLYQSRVAAGATTANACDWLVTALAGQLGAGLPSSARVNNAPVIESQAVTTASTGQAYAYAVQAHDADGDALTYALSGAPTGMTIDATGHITWPAPVGGNFALTVQVSDGVATASQSFTLAVTTGVSALQVNPSLSPSIANAGQTVTLSAGATSGSGAVATTATLDGVLLVLNAQGMATFIAPASGAHPIVVSASDGKSTVTRELILTVSASGDVTPPTVDITSPAADSGLRGIVTISGTATDANFAYYKLLVRRSNDADTAWVEFARGLSPVTNNALGTIDTSRFQNGTYEIGLVVADVNGQQSSKSITVDFIGNLKLGQFRLSFADVRAEAPGMPLMLTRTYDSTKKDVLGDFGWGWSASDQDLTVRKNVKQFGQQWDVVTRSFQNCIIPSSKRRITITLPDGGLYRFDGANSPECQTATVPDVDIVFTAVPGPTGGAAGRVSAGGQLKIVDGALVQAQGGRLVDETGQTWNPTDFELTTDEGFKYLIRENVGILSVTDPYGNKVTYSTAAIGHSANLTVSLSRDALGRITQATDPNGKSITYTYNAAGDLETVTDRAGQVTKFTYSIVPVANTGTTSGNADMAHLLSSITDARGQVVMSSQFDQFGRLTSAADGLGQATQQSFDVANNTQTVTDRKGNKTTYTFDADGNITKVVNALNQVTTSTFDANGNETSTTDALNHRTTRTFDAATGKQLTETNALNQTTTTQYAGTGPTYQRLNPLVTIDARGNATNYSYDSPTQPGATPASIDEPLGRSTTIGIDNKGNLKTLNIAGEKITYGYDLQGRKASETNGLGQSVGYTYDANGNEASRTVYKTVNGQQVSFTTARKYDSENRVIEETDALGGKVTSTYNAAGKLATQTDALGNTTTYSYDANARLIKTTHSDGTSEGTDYDANGNEIAKTDRKGRTTRMDYDALNRLVKTTFPDGTSESTEYDAAGRTIATTDRSGKRATMEYDDANRQTASIDATGLRTTYTFDANGNKTSQTIAGLTTNFDFDELNRLRQTTFPDGSTRTTVYRPDNRKQSETDERGVTTTFGYDAAGRLTSVQQTLGGTSSSNTTYGYDETGLKVKQTDALGRDTSWTADANNRITSRTIQDGSTETFQYDSNGNRVAKTTFAGERLTFTYDANNRLTSQVVPQGTGGNSAIGASSYTFAYSATGQLVSEQEQGATTLNGTQTFEYDANDRLTKVTSPVGQISYGYDSAGNITERSVAGAGTVRYEYDAAGRMTKVIAPDGKEARYTYDAAGRLVTTERDLNPVNGQAQVLVTYTRYDPAGRDIAIAHVRKVGSSDTLVAGQAIARGPGGTINEIDTYRSGTYDGSTGQFAGVPATTQAFEYDGNARLTRENRTVNGNNVDTHYEYDAAGNRTKKIVTTAGGTDVTSYTYDAADRLTQESTSLAAGGASTIGYTWDGNGNLASKTEPGKVTLYRFDAQNRLIDIRTGATSVLAQGAAPGVSYAYDVGGNRIRKTTPSGASGYLVDNTHDYSQVASETGITYVWGYQLVRQTKNGSADADDMFPLQGHLGSSLGAVDVDGNVVEQIDGDGYGNVEQPASAIKQTHLYDGEYWDKDVQMVYLRARWYDVKLGSFVSADAFEGRNDDPLSLNRYSFAKNDGINNKDPSGFDTLVAQAEAGNVMGALSQIALPATAGLAMVSANYRIKQVIMSRAAAQDCARSFASGQRAFNPSDCPGVRMPMVIMSESQMLGIGEHVQLSQAGGSPSILHRTFVGKLPNRLIAMMKCRLGVTIPVFNSGSSCDEYPFASSQEGGLGATVAKVPLRSNLIQGGVLSSFYSNCLIAPDTNSPLSEFVVIPASASPTSFQCRF